MKFISHEKCKNPDRRYELCAVHFNEGQNIVISNIWKCQPDMIGI